MGRAKDYAMMYGPLGSASAGIEHLAENLYYSYLLDESVKKHRELQQEYEDALLQNDAQALAQAKYEIELYEGVFNLTLSYNLGELES
tara:strand:- start:750 stop:1013 length:264 start_codon:yes stop_codon:yes gene_type:complete